MRTLDADGLSLRLSIPKGKAGDSRPEVKVGITCRLLWGIVFLTSWHLAASAASLPAENSKIGAPSNFEGGSVGKVEQVSLTHRRCAVKGQSDPDHRNRQENWYYFEVTNLPHRPMTNLDGVADGGVRFKLNRYDLNRNWDTPNAKTMPEIWGQLQAVLDWVDSGHHVTYLFHCTTTKRDANQLPQAMLRSSLRKQYGRERATCLRLVVRVRLQEVIQKLLVVPVATSCGVTFRSRSKYSRHLP